MKEEIWGQSYTIHFEGISFEKKIWGSYIYDKSLTSFSPLLFSIILNTYYLIVRPKMVLKEYAKWIIGVVFQRSLLRLLPLYLLQSGMGGC